MYVHICAKRFYNTSVATRFLFISIIVMFVNKNNRCPINSFVTMGSIIASKSIYSLRSVETEKVFEVLSRLSFINIVYTLLY